jgi:hypothetical protein
VRQQTANNPERVPSLGFFFVTIRAVFPSNIVAVVSVSR